MKGEERAAREKEQSHCCREMEGGWEGGDMLCEQLVGWEKKEGASSDRAT